MCEIKKDGGGGGECREGGRRWCPFRLHVLKLKIFTGRRES